MKTSAKFSTIAVAIAMLAAPSFPQSPNAPAPAVQVRQEEPAKFFRLDFILKELEGGKVINSRSYSTSASTRASDGGCSIRSGDKVGRSDGSGKISYIDIGVSIDCNNLRLVDNQLAIHLSVDISNPSTEPHPEVVIRENRWSATTLVPIRKAVTLFSSDSTTSKGQTQLELTATPLP